uniref:Uncharacterized protein n=1 Tax=Glossina pallidipes TaxID=7398 RepID=A0A1A9Z1D5_GLOPL
MKNMLYGKLGAIIAEQQYSKILKLTNILNRYQYTLNNKIKVCFECNGVKIIGLLNVVKSGLLRWNVRGTSDSYFFGIESCWSFRLSKRHTMSINAIKQMWNRMDNKLF